MTVEEIVKFLDDSIDNLGLREINQTGENAAYTRGKGIGLFIAANLLREETLEKE